MSDEKTMGQVIQIDEARIRDHLGEMVRGTVEETLNAMLDAEADRLCGAGRYERSEARQDTRAGSYERIAVPQATDEGAPGLFAQYVTVGLAPLVRRLFDDQSNALGDAAKEVVAGIDDLVRRIARCRRRWRRRG